ncbi:hypothetical protein AFLA_013667 [Aspergillus flavus NRRL3357]|nr:hypothetical protein AFLA_013667 [Aspergillus flavus NRRL3357]
MPSPPKAKTASITVFLLGMPRSLQTIANGYTLLPEPTELYRCTLLATSYGNHISRLRPDGVGHHDEPEATPRGRGSRTVACPPVVPAVFYGVALRLA